MWQWKAQTPGSSPKEAPRRALLCGARPLGGGGCHLAGVPEAEAHQQRQDQSGDHHADSGEEGDLPDHPPSVGVKQDRPEGLTLEHGLSLALKSCQLCLHGSRVLARCSRFFDLSLESEQRSTKLGVGLASTDLLHVQADVAGVRLGLGPSVDLLACVTTKDRLLLGGHLSGRTDSDVLRLETVTNVV